MPWISVRPRGTMLAVTVCRTLGLQKRLDWAYPEQPAGMGVCIKSHRVPEIEKFRNSKCCTAQLGAAVYTGYSMSS